MGVSREEEVIARIYEAAFDGALWHSTLVDIAQSIGAHHIFLGTHDVIHGAHSLAPLTDPAHLEEYNEHWVDRNPCVKGMITAPLGRIYHTPGELVDGDAYRRSEIFNGWCRSGDMGFGSMCVAMNRDPRRHAFTSVYKRWGVDEFEQEERDRYAAAVFHITRALELQARVNDLRNDVDTADAVMAVMEDGVILTDAQGLVLHMAGTAGDILERSGISCELGQPVPWPEHAGLLARLIASCESGRPGRMGGAAAIPREGQSILQVTVLPVPANQRGSLDLHQPRRPAALLVLSDPDLRLERVMRRLSTLYGLTPAEVRFATEIARGDGKRRAAERCGISYATARAHLSSIFEKTGVHRQAELVRLLVGG